MLDTEHQISTVLKEKEDCNQSNSRQNSNGADINVIEQNLSQLNGNLQGHENMILEI